MVIPGFMANKGKKMIIVLLEMEEAEKKGEDWLELKKHFGEA